MDINMVAQRAGLGEDKARTAVETVGGSLKERGAASSLGGML